MVLESHCSHDDCTAAGQTWGNLSSVTSSVLCFTVPAFHWLLRHASLMVLTRSFFFNLKFTYSYIILAVVAGGTLNEEDGLIVMVGMATCLIPFHSLHPLLRAVLPSPASSGGHCILPLQVALIQNQVQGSPPGPGQLQGVQVASSPAVIIKSLHT